LAHIFVRPCELNSRRKLEFSGVIDPCYEKPIEQFQVKRSKVEVTGRKRKKTFFRAYLCKRWVSLRQKDKMILVPFYAYRQIHASAKRV